MRINRKHFFITIFIFGFSFLLNAAINTNNPYLIDDGKYGYVVTGSKPTSSGGSSSGGLSTSKPGNSSGGNSGGSGSSQSSTPKDDSSSSTAGNNTNDTSSPSSPDTSKPKNPNDNSNGNGNNYPTAEQIKNEADRKAAAEKISELNAFEKNRIADLNQFINAASIIAEKCACVAEEKKFYDSLFDGEKELIENHPEIKNVMMCGDPVQIATGKYYCASDDHVTDMITFDFAIHREYFTGKQSGIAFGKYWASLFDSRIIRGRSDSFESIVNAINNKISVESKKINNYGNYSSNVNNAINSLKQYSDSLRAKYNASVSAATYNKYSLTSEYDFMNSIGSDYLCLIDESGNQILFKYDFDKNLYFPLNDLYKNRVLISVLNGNFENGYTLKYFNGVEKRYSKWGFLESLKMPNGYEIRFVYDAAPYQITSVYADGIKIYEVEWNENKIFRIKSCKDNTVLKYEYSSNELLCCDSGKGNSKNYQYSSEGNLVKRFENGKTVIVNYGKTSEGFVVVSVQDDYGVEKFNYLKSQNSMEYVSADGDKTVFHFNDENLVYEELHSDGTYLYKDFNIYGKVSLIKDIFGTRKYTYDDYGVLSSCIYDNGSYEQWNYNSSNHNLVSYKDRDGVVTNFYYDANGNVISIKRSGKSIFTASYNSWGGVTSYSGFGNTDEIKYDSKRNIISRRGMESEYDSNGKLIRCVDSSGNIAKYQWSENNEKLTVVINERLEIEYVFDSMENVLSVIESDLMTKETYCVEYIRDKKGRVIEKYIGHGKSNEDAWDSRFLRESYSYTPQGKLKQCTSYNRGIAVKNDGYGIRREYEYSNDNLLKYSVCYIDESNNVVEKKYETIITRSYKNGMEILNELRPDGKNVSTYSDRDGNILKIQKGDLVESQFQYTDSGKIKTYQIAWGGTYLYQYDPVSLQVSSVSKGSVLLESYEYDLMGKTSKVTYADGSYTTYKYSYGKNTFSVLEENLCDKNFYEYDLNGNLITKTYSEKNNAFLMKSDLSSSYTQKYGSYGVSFSKNFDAWKRTCYDSANDVHYEYDALGFVSVVWRKSLINKIQYEYNLFGKVSREISETGVVTDFSYDVNGNLISMKENGKVTWSGTYNDDGKLLTEKSLAFGKKEYSYDDLGFLVSVKQNGILQLKNTRSDNLKTVVHQDAKGNTWSDIYDEYGIGIKTSNRYGYAKTQVSDEKKNLMTITDYSGNKTLYQMSSADSTVKIKSYDGSINSIKMNSIGNIKSIFFESSKGANGKTEFTYGKNNELLKVDNVNHSEHHVSSLSYDQNGFRNSILTDRYKINYQRDSLGNIVNITASRGSNVINISIEYDDYGREVLRSDSSGIKVKTEYDNFSRIAYLSQENEKTKEKTSIINLFDDCGRIEYEIHNDGTFNYYEYDSFGRVSKYVSPVTTGFIESRKKNFDEAGVDFNFRGGEKYSIKSSSFNELSEKLRNKGFSQKVLYSSQESYVEEYKYDLCGNKIEAKTSAGSIKYDYDKENRLISVSGKKNIKYIYDADGRLIKESKTDLLKQYSYDGFGNLKTVQYIDLSTGVSVVRNYEYDSLGRQIRVWDDSGNDVSYLYDGTSRQLIATVSNKISNENSNWKYNNSDLKDEGSLFKTDYRYLNSETFGTYVEESELSESNSDKSKSDRYSGSISSQLEELAPRTDTGLFVYNKGNLLAYLGMSDSITYANDITGNVRSAYSSSDGSIVSISYDVSGNAYAFAQNGKNVSDLKLLKTTAGFMFKGMEYDSVSETYNNYRRRYDPSMNTFTSCDPILDGMNWYAYCNGDGVNFYDNGGTTIAVPKILKTMTYWGVSGTTERVLLGNSKADYIDDHGCFLCLICGVINTLYDSTLEMPEMNSVKKYFGDSDTYYAADMNTQTVLDRYNLTQEVNQRPNTKGMTDADKISEVNDNYNKKVVEVITAAASSETDYVVGLQVHLGGINPRTGKNYECDHFVATDGTMKQIDNKMYLKVIGTSDYDKPNSWLRTTWKEVKEGGVTSYYVPVDSINDVRLYSQACEN